MSDPKVRRNLRHEMTAKEAVKFVTEQTENALQNLVGSPLSYEALQAARAVCEQALKDLLRLRPPPIMEEVAIDISFVKNTMNVKMVPITDRAKQWMLDLAQKGETHPCDCLDCQPGEPQ